MRDQKISCAVPGGAIVADWPKTSNGGRGITYHKTGDASQQSSISTYCF